MSETRKQLKIFSFVQVVAMVLALASGIALVAFPGEGENALGLDPKTFGAVLCAVAAVAGVLAFCAAAQGIRGANVPSKLGPHAPLSATSALVAAVGGCLEVASSAPLGSFAFWLLTVVGVAALVQGRKVRAELDR